MRKSIFNLLLLGAIVALLGSCKDDEKPTGGSFTLDGEKVTLKKGFYYDGGYETDGDDTYYYWGVTLTSDDIVWDADQETLTGTGEMLYFGVYGFNAGETEVPTGTFKFDFADGESILDYVYLVKDFGGDGQDYISGWDAGQVTITKSGSKYTFNFTITNTDTETTISGKFTGTLSYGYWD